MPADSTSLAEEGALLPPHKLVAAGRFDEAWVRARLGAGPWPARNPDDNVADLEAMVAANRAGEALLHALVAEIGADAARVTMAQLRDAAATKVRREIARLAPGVRRFADRLDDGTPIAVSIAIDGDRMRVDFAGTGAAVAGNLNAPPAVVRAAVLYVLRALVDENIPLNGGCLVPVELRIPPGSLLDPPPGSAVVGGNVETSQRVVDVLLGALGLAAASQGTMNNVAFGDARFGYYETIGGGAGAGRDFDGASCVHVHMTNTRITDAEILELRYPGPAGALRAAPRQRRRRPPPRRRRHRASLRVPRAGARVDPVRAPPRRAVGARRRRRRRVRSQRGDPQRRERRRAGRPRDVRARSRRRVADRDAGRRRLRRAVLTPLALPQRRERPRLPPGA